MRLCSIEDLFSFVRVVLFNACKIYKPFYIFQGDFEILKLPCFKLLCVLPLSDTYKEPTQTSEFELFPESC